MAAIVVDTSVWIESGRGRTFAELESALAEGRVALSPLVAAELLSGKVPFPKRIALEYFLKDLPLHSTPYEHWAAVGKLRSRLAEQGVAVSVPDAHVAQCALDLNGVLLTLDRVFDRVAAHTSLRLVNPDGKR